MEERKQLFELIDIISSEYGWSYNEIIELPFDTLVNLYYTIMQRKKSEYQLLAKIIAVGASCGFSGKMDGLDKLFKDDSTPSNPEEEISQLRQLCSDFGMNQDEFDKQLKSGKVVI